MRPVYVISTEPLSGKTGLCTSLLLEARKRGQKAGYMKPIGTSPVRVGSLVIDEDPYHVRRVLSLDAEPGLMSPVMLTPQFVHEQLARSRVNCLKSVSDAYAKYAQTQDVMIVEGLSDLHQGRWLHLSARQIAKLLRAVVVVIVKFDNESVLDTIVAAKDILADQLLGVVLNRVDPDRLPLVNDSVIPFLTDEGVRVLGAMREDEGLKALPVNEIVKQLGATFICGEEYGQECVESFMVGAMGERKALSFFKKRAGKAVITGGDREDIQLAALDTQTRALILTGNQKPTKRVVAKANEVKVPVLMVDMDTMSTVERVEDISSRLRAHDDRRIQRLYQLVSRSIDLPHILDGLAE